MIGTENKVTAPNAGTEAGRSPARSNQSVEDAVRTMEGKFSSIDIIRKLGWSEIIDLSFVSGALRRLATRGVIEQAGKSERVNGNKGRLLLLWRKRGEGVTPRVLVFIEGGQLQRVQSDLPIEMIVEDVMKEDRSVYRHNVGVAGDGFDVAWEVANRQANEASAPEAEMESADDVAN